METVGRLRHCRAILLNHAVNTSCDSEFLVPVCSFPASSPAILQDGKENQLFFFLNHCFILCVYVSAAHLLCSMWLVPVQKPEEGVGSPGTGGTNACEPD